MHSLSRVVSKLAALAMLASLTGALYMFTVAPFLSHIGGLKERIEDQRVLLGRLEAAASDERRAEEIDRLAQSQSLAEITLPGASDALRVAELQTLMSRLTEAEGIEIRSTRSVPAREIEGVRLVGLEAQLATTIDRLQKLLHALESSRPYVLVETLHVLAPVVFREDDPQAAGVLEVRLGLMGMAPAGKG